jgi:site-specific recombinase XerD
VNFHVIAVRALLKFLLKHDYQVLSPEKLELAKTPMRSVAYLSTQEIKTMLETVEDNYRKKNTPISARNVALIHTLY